MILAGAAFILSYAGERIMENHKRIGVHAYNLIWYNTSPAITKMLQMIIMRSQKNVGVTAGSFYFVSLHSFGTVTNFS